MADPDNPYGSVDSTNFDNDFEKVDPALGDSEVSPQPNIDDMLGLGTEPLVSTTSPDEEDLYSASRPSRGSEAEPTNPPEPLLSFDDEPTPQLPSEPLVTPLVTPAAPDSSAYAAEEVKETQRAPSPPKTAEVVKPTKKPIATAGSGEPWIKRIDPRVIDLIYWRDVKKTGIVFGSMIVTLLSLAMFSVLSVIAYLSLAALTVTVTFVVYKKVLGAVQKAGEGHPFKQYLDMDISLPEEKVHQMAEIIMRNLSTTVKELRRLFLVEDVVDSLKFGLLLWVLTYIGAWFNGMTLLILDVVAIFTIPKFYETYKVQIDQYLDIAKTRVKDIMKKVQEKLPLPGKKKQA